VLLAWWRERGDLLAHRGRLREEEEEGD